MTAANAARCAIAVMAKAPRAGHVKTRMCPPLTPDEAQALGAAFLRDTTDNLAMAAAETAIDGFVAYAPAGTESLFDGMLHPATKMVLADGVGVTAPGVTGFGMSLLHAMRSLFAAGYGAVCVLNADGPTLPTAYLVDAARTLLAGEPAVIGPADDGGYYMLGLRAPDAHWFADIAWSTDAVFAQTLSRGKLRVLPRWYDVDDAAALRRLLVDADADAYPAFYTRAAISRLRIATRL